MNPKYAPFVLTGHQVPEQLIIKMPALELNQAVRRIVQKHQSSRKVNVTDLIASPPRTLPWITPRLACGWDGRSTRFDESDAAPMAIEAH